MIFRFGPFELDDATCELRRDRTALHVEPKVLDLLFYLVRNRDRLVTKQELLDNIWPDAVVAEGALTRAMSLVRTALGEKGREPGAIETVSGRGYRFRADVEVATAAEKPPARLPARPRRLRLVLAGVGGLLLVLGTAVWLKWPAPLGLFLDVAGLGEPPRAPALPDRPSLVVLPFRDLSPESARRYLADGVSADVTTGLARFRELFVIAWSSASTYRDAPTDVERVRRELGVRYLVEGTVRAAGERVIVTAQLIDAGTGVHLWSGRYDRQLGDVLALETDVSAEILSALDVQIETAERERVRQRVALPPDAYAAFVEGRTLWSRFVRTDNEDAGRLFERAIAQEPGFARAHAFLAASHVTAYGLGWDPVPDRLERAGALARRALELDPFESVAHSALAGVGLWTGRPEEAVSAARRAVEVGPNSDACHGMLAMALAAEGRASDAISALNRAFRLSPRRPAPYWMLLGHFQAAAGRTEQAAETFERVRLANADLIPPRVELISYYDDRGRGLEARTLADEIRRVNPAFSADLALRLDRRRADPDAASRLRAQLQRAGLP